MYEVHMFQAVATATASTEGPYRPGDRHAMLVLIRQTSGSDHDWAEAEARVTNAGWSGVTFARAGTLTSEKLNGKDEDFLEAYEHALNEGRAIIVYSDPVIEEE